MFALSKKKANVFTTKKRPRDNAFDDLKNELETREKTVRSNTKYFDRKDELVARTEGRSQKCGQLVYFDISISKKWEVGESTGRLIFEVFDDILPKTCEAFLKCMEAEEDPKYNQSVFNFVKPGQYCEGGAIDGTRWQDAPSRSHHIFTRANEEANYDLLHTNAGILCLSDGKSPKFRITFRDLETFDNEKKIIFGRVVAGLDILHHIEDHGDTSTGIPTKTIKVTDCKKIHMKEGEKLQNYIKILKIPEERKEHERRTFRYEGVEMHTTAGGL